MEENWTPTRFTVGLAQGLTREAILALRQASDQEGVDPRAMAAILILEGLRRRGLLPDSRGEENE